MLPSCLLCIVKKFTLNNGHRRIPEFTGNSSGICFARIPQLFLTLRCSQERSVFLFVSVFSADDNSGVGADLTISKKNPRASDSPGLPVPHAAHDLPRSVVPVAQAVNRNFALRPDTVQETNHIRDATQPHLMPCYPCAGGTAFSTTTPVRSRLALWLQQVFHRARLFLSNFSRGLGAFDRNRNYIIIAEQFTKRVQQTK